ncbi:MAG TPA: prolipoprotein diacylglyceryl transferase [Firmicutes bacterium]|nr:prolipoprotein diacylglyceryl transferase [Bacillota bacterium]
MRPILFEIGSLPIYSYGAMLCLAFLMAMLWSFHEAPAEKINREYLYDLYIIVMLLSLVGSRAAYVLLNWDFYKVGPWWRVLAFREGGLTFLGGLILAILGGIIYCHRKKIGFLKYLDFFAPFIALGYAITRIGCFLNGCCYGVVTSLPWGVVFPAVDSYPRHPTQLYASASALLIFILLRAFRKHKDYDGFVFTQFMIFYGVYRFIVEFYRISEPSMGFLTQGQLASLVLIFAGVIIFLWKKGEKRKIGETNKKGAGKL